MGAAAASGVDTVGGAEPRSTALLGGRYSPLAFTELRAVHADGRCELGGGLTVRADAVAVLIGSSPDLSFLPASVRAALDAAGAPPDTYDGVRATHPVFVDVEPFSMEVRGVRGLYALGPLRGDNFARFAIHDGHGVAEAIRARRDAGGADQHHEACEHEDSEDMVKEEAA